MTFKDMLTPLNVALVLLLGVATIAGFVLIPAGTTLPIHWGISGEADGFATRDLALLLLPAIALAITALLFGIQRFGNEERRRAGRHIIAATIPALLALFLAIQTATVLIGTGQAVDMVRIAVLGVGLLFVVLGNIVPKSLPNGVAGIRLPWTLSDPANWQATNRFGGMLMMAGGAAIALAALVTGHPATLVTVTLIAVLAPIAVTMAYSYRLARPR